MNNVAGIGHSGMSLQSAQNGYETAQRMICMLPLSVQENRTEMLYKKCKSTEHLMGFSQHDIWLRIMKNSSAACLLASATCMCKSVHACQLRSLAMA